MVTGGNSATGTTLDYENNNNRDDDLFAKLANVGTATTGPKRHGKESAEEESRGEREPFIRAVVAGGNTKMTGTTQDYENNNYRDDDLFGAEEKKGHLFEMETGGQEVRGDDRSRSGHGFVIPFVDSLFFVRGQESSISVSTGIVYDEDV